MLHVIATLELHPGTREQFLVEFHKLAPDVRRESGCIEYAAAVDMASGLEAQVPIRSDVVVIVEKWGSLEALHAHMTMPHFRSYLARVGALVARRTLQVLVPVDRLIEQS